MNAAVGVTKSSIDLNDKISFVPSNEEVKSLFKKDLQTKYGYVVPSKVASKMFGADHGLPVIDGCISIDVVSSKLVEMRSLALSSSV